MKKLIIIVFGCGMLLIGNSCIVNTRPAQTKTVVIKKAPRNHKILVVKGKRYYYWGGTYYKKTRRGFVVVNV